MTYLKHVGMAWLKLGLPLTIIGAMLSNCPARADACSGVEYVDCMDMEMQQASQRERLDELEQQVDDLEEQVEELEEGEE